MPSWALSYLVVLAVVATWHLVAGLRSARTGWVVVVNFLSAAVAGLFLAAYWYPGILGPLGVMAPVVLLGALGWEVKAVTGEIRRLCTAGSISANLGEGVTDWTLLIGGAIAILFAYAVGVAALLRSWSGAG